MNSLLLVFRYPFSFCLFASLFAFGCNSASDTASAPVAPPPQQVVPPVAAPPKTVNPAPCASNLALGNWENVNVFDTLAFLPDCSFTSSACHSTGSVPSLENATGLTSFAVAKTDTLDGCLGVGAHQCLYSIYTAASGKTRADLTCDGLSTLTYERTSN